jgi:hypothetical protein
MLLIPGYTIIEAIEEGKKTILYRGEREQDKKSVLIKVINDKHPWQTDIANLQHE